MRTRTSSFGIRRPEMTYRGGSCQTMLEGILEYAELGVKYPVPGHSRSTVEQCIRRDGLRLKASQKDGKLFVERYLP